MPAWLSSTAAGTLTTTPDGFAVDPSRLIGTAVNAGKKVVRQDRNPTCEPRRQATPIDVTSKINSVAAIWNVPAVHQFSLLTDRRQNTIDCIHPIGAYDRVKVQNTFEVIETIL